MALINDVIKILNQILYVNPSASSKLSGLSTDFSSTTDSQF